MLSQQQHNNLDELSEKIRKLPLMENAIKPAQPGYFEGNILFIFQNPSYPRENKDEDRILLDKDVSIKTFNLAYKNTLEKSLLGNFIRKLGLNFNQVSITNLVKFPTKNNTPPSDKLITAHINYTLMQVELLTPKLIILVGELPRTYLYNYLKNNYMVLTFRHYAYLMRTGQLEETTIKYRKEIEDVIGANKSNKNLYEF